MYLHMMQYIGINLVLLFGNAVALPLIDFVRDFALKHQRSSVVLHVPDNLPGYDSVKWYVKEY